MLARMSAIEHQLYSSGSFTVLWSSRLLWAADFAQSRLPTWTGHCTFSVMCGNCSLAGRLQAGLIIVRSVASVAMLHHHHHHVKTMAAQIAVQQQTTMRSVTCL